MGELDVEVQSDDDESDGSTEMQESIDLLED